MSFDIDIGKEGREKRLTIRIDPTKKIIESISGIISYWDIEEDIVLLHEGTELNIERKWANTDIKKGDFVLIKRQGNNKCLPKDIWLSRIENEVESFKEKGIEVIERKLTENSILLKLKLNDIPGPVKIGSNIALSFNHVIELNITRNYPYSSPILRWKSDIFHPNIKLPTKGGGVSMKYLENWSFSSNINTLIKEIVNLLLEPDIERKWDTRNCTQASEKYLSSGFPSTKNR